MFSISVSCGNLSDSYLKRITQLGVACVDFGSGDSFPGVKEQGYPDLDELLKIKKKIYSWGLRINRVTLPDITEKFMGDKEGSEVELENTDQAMRVFGEAGMPIARQRFEGDTFNHLITFYRSEHRAGFLGSGGSRWLTGDQPKPRSEAELKAYRFHHWPLFAAGDPPTREELDNWWVHFCRVYERLVPIAEEYDIKLAIHPSDIPLPDTPFGTLGFHRVIDAFPSPNVGYLYCCGTRAEAGGLPLVLDEIQNYGRKDRIFMVHFRNVRGSLATAGGYEETLLDDGDMNMFKIVQALEEVGFDGCLNPDHIFPLEGDGSDAGGALAYSVGYIKALSAALAAI